MTQKWLKRFMELTKMFGSWSKDPSRGVGAVILNEDKIVVSMGYNGLPRNCRDDIEERYVKPAKLLYTEHAERNALYHASRLGVSVKGCTMFASLFPCADCARGMIQSGITQLVTVRPDYLDDTWGKSWSAAFDMMREAKISIIFLDKTTYEIEL